MKTQEQEDYENHKQGLKDFISLVKETPASFFKYVSNRNLIFGYEDGVPTMLLTTDYYTKVMVKNCPIKARLIDELKYELEMLPELYDI